MVGSEEVACLLTCPNLRRQDITPPKNSPSDVASNGTGGERFSGWLKRIALRGKREKSAQNPTGSGTEEKRGRI